MPSYRPPFNLLYFPLIELYHSKGMVGRKWRGSTDPELLLLYHFEINRRVYHKRSRRIDGNLQ